MFKHFPTGIVGNYGDAKTTPQYNKYLKMKSISDSNTSSEHENLVLFSYNV